MTVEELKNRFIEKSIHEMNITELMNLNDYFNLKEVQEIFNRLMIERKKRDLIVLNIYGNCTRATTKFQYTDKELERFGYKKHNNGFWYRYKTEEIR